MHPIVSLMMLMSVLFPQRLWAPVNQPVNVQVHAADDVMLVLSDLNGKPIDPPSGADSILVSPGGTGDIHKMYLPTFSQAGTYLLFAVPKGKAIADFVGTPLVLEIRKNVGIDSMPGPTVVHLEPLVYAAVDTDQGPMTMIFFFDGAPSTVDNFLTLCEQNFYDGLTFHRIVPGFIIQGGDPRGDGTGGPGYSINAEINDHLHLPGAVSMARETDPAERSGAAPRPDYLNSAGSQFFISLDHDKTAELDHHYTVFGTVARGMDTVNKIAALPVGGPLHTTPQDAPVIKSIVIKAVTPVDDPYATILHLPETKEPASEPTTAPVMEPTTEAVAQPNLAHIATDESKSTSVPGTNPSPQPTIDPNMP